LHVGARVDGAVAHVPAEALALTGEHEQVAVMRQAPAEHLAVAAWGYAGDRLHLLEVRLLVAGPHVHYDVGGRRAEGRDEELERVEVVVPTNVAVAEEHAARRDAGEKAIHELPHRPPAPVRDPDHAGRLGRRDGSRRANAK